MKLMRSVGVGVGEARHTGLTGTTDAHQPPTHLSACINVLILKNKLIFKLTEIV